MQTFKNQKGSHNPTICRNCCLKNISTNSPKPPAYENNDGASRLRLSPYTAYYLARNKNLSSLFILPENLVTYLPNEQNKQRLRR